MAAWIKNRKADLQSGGLGEPGAGRAVRGESLAHLWRVTVTDGGPFADLTGYTAYVEAVRPGGGTVTFAAGVVGHVVSALIPGACYVYQGDVEAKMWIINSTTGAKQVIDSLVILVEPGGTGTAIDPGEEVASLPELLAQLTAARDATNDANNAAIYANGIGAGLDARMGAAELLAKNIIVNSDGSTLTGWMQLSDFCTGSLVNGWIRSTKNTGYPYYGQNFTEIPAGHKMYMRSRMRTNRNLDVYLELHTTGMGGGGGGSIGIPVTTADSAYSVIVSALTNIKGFSFSCFSGTAAGDYVEVYKPIMIDLTAVFGAGHEPSAAVMDAYLAFWPDSWFNETVNIAPASKAFPALLEARKLLVTPDWIYPTLLSGATANATDPIRYRKDAFGRVQFEGGATVISGDAVIAVPVGYRKATGKTGRFPVIKNDVSLAQAVITGGALYADLGTINFSGVSYFSEA